MADFFMYGWCKCESGYLKMHCDMLMEGLRAYAERIFSQKIRLQRLLIIAEILLERMKHKLYCHKKNRTNLCHLIE